MIRDIRNNFNAASYAVELVPDRSLSPKQLMSTIGVSAGALITASVGFITIGAIPPAIFLMVVATGLTLGLSRSHYIGLQRQRIVLDETGLTLIYTHPDDDEPDRFGCMNPLMLRIEKHPSKETTIIGFGRKGFELGGFLNHADKKKLYNELRGAVRQWQP